MGDLGWSMNTLLLFLILVVLVVALVPAFVLEGIGRLVQAIAGLAVVAWLLLHIPAFGIHLPRWAEIILGAALLTFWGAALVLGALELFRSNGPAELPDTTLGNDVYPPAHPLNWSGF